MKKVLFLLLMFIGMFVLVGCDKDTYTIALITDIGDIDDKSFNQGAWEGVLEFVEAREEAGEEITSKYYKPTAEDTDAYLAAIELAIANGAEIVVTPGYMFEEPVNIAQKENKDVKFVLLDGNPANADKGAGTLEDNTYSIFYAEEQAGYLAGYAAVKEGFTKLGYLGGVAVPAVIRFGHGYVLGADAAAAELGVQVEVEYNYTNTFNADPAVLSTASSLYNGGTEVIFACGGSIGQSVMSAANSADAAVIGVDIDQSGDSETVITSAIKGLTSSVVLALEAYFDDNWDTVGGKSVSLDAAQDGVGLPMDTSRFETFTKDQYNEVFNKMVDGELVIDVDLEQDVETLETTNTTVNEF